VSDSFDEADQRSPRAEKAKIAAKALGKGLVSLASGGGLGVELFNGWEESKRRREAATVQDVIDKLGTDLEALKAKLDNDEELASMWERALGAARSARFERHRFAYVGIMAGAVYATHEERLRAKVLLRLLDQLEEEHLLLIAAIDAEAALPAEQLSDGSPGTRGATPERLKARLPQLAQVLEVLISTLLSMNIIENTLSNTYAGVAGARRYALTESGKNLTKVLTSDDPITPSDPPW
jgi:hypothetical protein